MLSQIVFQKVLLYDIKEVSKVIPYFKDKYDSIFLLSHIHCPTLYIIISAISPSNFLFVNLNLPSHAPESTLSQEPLLAQSKKLYVVDVHANLVEVTNLGSIPIEFVKPISAHCAILEVLFVRIKSLPAEYSNITFSAFVVNTAYTVAESSALIAEDDILFKVSIVSSPSKYTLGLKFIFESL